MVQLRHNCNCDTCTGGEHTPGSFGGWRCMCSCHHEKIIKPKPILYCDMDGVLCNFRSAFEQDKQKNPSQPFPQSAYGFFLNLEPKVNALSSIQKLSEKFDIYILTRPSIYNLLSYTEKAMWIQQHLGVEYLNKLIMSCDKSLLKGDYLIDDSITDGQDRFEGKLILFGSELYPNWITVVNDLMNIKER